MITETRIKINKADLSKSAREITQVFSDALRKWREEASKTYYMLKKYGKPRCTRCGVEMEEYDARQFKKLRQKLADEAIKISPQVAESLLEVGRLFCTIFLNQRQHGDMEMSAKELLGLFAVIITGIITGVAILAVWSYVYELTQSSIVTWAVGVLLAFAVMHISKKLSYP